MRISDWSSDVCSSDLANGSQAARLHPAGGRRACGPGYGSDASGRSGSRHSDVSGGSGRRHSHVATTAMQAMPVAAIHRRGAVSSMITPQAAMASVAIRSEEHTSELQSLMRISYAVFCLKKKKSNNQTIIHHHINKQKTQT